MKILYKKECEDCSIQAENEVLQDLLDRLRDILQVPDRTDICYHAEKIMKGR